MKLPYVSLTVVGSILLTGALLNFLGNGGAGTTGQKIAKYVTNGYGV